MAISFQQILEIVRGGRATLDKYILIAGKDGDTAILGARIGEKNKFTPEDLAKQLAIELEDLANALRK